MVDYSKWNSYAAELSDSDEDVGKLSVTKLDNKSKITIGPDGATVVPSPGIYCNQITDAIKMSSRTNNGGSTSKFDWQQSRNDISLFVFLPSGSKAVQIKVFLKESQLTIYHRGNEIINGKFKYPILETNAVDIEWEIKDDEFDKSIGVNPPRILEMKFHKKSVIPDATLWWSCVFEGDPEIDTTTIKGRNPSANLASWDAAHRMFKERIANRELIEVNDEEEQI